MTKYLALVVPFAFAACDAAQQADLDLADAAVEQAPVPLGFPAMVVSEMFGGAPVRLTWADLAPGTQVRFAVTLQGEGAGPCPAALNGICMDLLPPVYQATTAVADANGVATTTINYPASASGTATFQAFGFHPSTGVVASNTFMRRIGPGICSFIFRPVCGIDGNTYSNDCLAYTAGWPVDYEGSCL
ncbi:MAG: hypothetical protein H6733_07180 [Alphaproteobacteria bacterium]|nr:hypothetical protein [Alphaproteobacteria bacterium]